MSLPLAAASPTAYWYLARGTGVVALLLLTTSVVLGILDVRRFSAPRWPRFAVDRLHRDVSLLVLAVLVVHIITSVLDSFAPILLTDGVIPFVSSYRPLWLGLGALGFDVLVAVAITSVVRRRLGYAAWRAVHWLAYLSWPVSVFHGLGTGTDTKQGWMLALTVLCLLAVAAAIALRVVRARSDSPLRPLWLALTLATPVGLAAFVVLGPLAPHWAARAGTPVALLRKAHPAAAVAAAGAARVAHRSARTPAHDAISVPFTAQLRGNITQVPAPGGAVLDLVLRCSGGINGEMRVRMAGAPMQGGGLSMTGSQVELTAVGLTSALQGKIDTLEGQDFAARVSNPAGTSLELHASLNIDNTSDRVTGTLTAGHAGALAP